MLEGWSFKALVGLGLALAVLLVSGLIYAFAAACPDAWTQADILCLFLPTSDDVATHLLSYVMAGLAVAGIARGWLLWRVQRRSLTSLARMLRVNGAIDGQRWPGVSVQGLEGRVYLVDTTEPFCFTSGLISPCVHLSRGMEERLASEELQAVLLHEKHHVDSRDPLRILLGSTLVSVLFFAPVLKDFFKRYLMEKELAADQSAVLCQGHKRGIAAALHKMVHETSAVSIFPAADFENNLDQRIDHLAGNNSRGQPVTSVFRLSITLAVTALLLLVVFLPLPSHQL